MSMPIPYEKESFRPPALVVKTVVLHPVLTKSKPMDGKLDTGASISTIPEEIKNSLGLLPAGETNASGFKGPAQKEKTYYVDITFNDFSFKSVKVITTERSYGLVGRDILNQLKLFADGKNQIFTLEDTN